MPQLDVADDLADLASLSFEEALRRLEQTTLALERGDLPLEQALAAYEQGCQLQQRCKTLLEQAELKIQTLSKP
jgi:exodeoxyribonuclease VII small subunit